MIIHIMKDGTIKKDITGHVVKMEDAPGVYQLFDAINSGKIKKHSEVKKYAKVI